MLTVSDSEKEGGVAPGKDAHVSVYVVCPCIGLEVFPAVPEDKVFQRPVGLTAVPSPFVPETEHDDALLTPQLIFVVAPLRRSRGLARRRPVTVMAGNSHGREPLKLVAAGFSHVVGAGQLESGGGSARQLPAQSYAPLPRCPQELTAADSHSVPASGLQDVLTSDGLTTEDGIGAGGMLEAGTNSGAKGGVGVVILSVPPGRTLPAGAVSVKSLFTDMVTVVHAPQLLFKSDSAVEVFPEASMFAQARTL